MSIKIPFLPIHLNPKRYISRIRTNYGDSVSIRLKNNVRGEKGIPGFFRNITPIGFFFYKEFGEVFDGVLCGDFIDK